MVVVAQETRTLLEKEGPLAMRYLLALLALDVRQDLGLLVLFLLYRNLLLLHAREKQSSGGCCHEVARTSN